MNIIPKVHHKTSRWSGGSTTELAIFPPGSEYASRDFRWRVSSATIEANTSTFTPLPGFRRLLMLTDGHLELAHEGHHTARLNPFDHDWFDGAWVTHCRGQGRDLNVMLSSGYDAAIQIVRLDDVSPTYSDGQGLLSGSHGGEQWSLYYTLDDPVTLIEGTDKATELNPNDLVVVPHHQRVPGTMLTIQREQKSRGTVLVIRVAIWQNGDGGRRDAVGSDNGLGRTD